MREIDLGNGLVALVDETDYDSVAAHNWHPARDASSVTWYAQRNVQLGGRRTTIQMHRELMGNPPGALIDHRDRNGLNNQRSNLRVCTDTESARNRRRVRVAKSSRFHGVCWEPRRHLWHAQIQLAPGRKLHFFESDEEAAARAYDAAAREHFGEFAVTNFPRVDHG